MTARETHFLNPWDRELSQTAGVMSVTRVPMELNVLRVLLGPSRWRLEILIVRIARQGPIRVKLLRTL